jgi:hypothetical protein
MSSHGHNRRSEVADKDTPARSASNKDTYFVCSSIKSKSNVLLPILVNRLKRRSGNRSSLCMPNKFNNIAQHIFIVRAIGIAFYDMHI